MKINTMVPGLPAEQYHGDMAVGHSGLVRIMRSPAHFQEYVSNPPVPTPAMAFGTAVHAAILEPKEFGDQYAVVDEAELEGTLESLDDFKAAADKLGIAYGVPTKDELKAAIKAADTEGACRFKDDVQAEMAALTQEKLQGTLQSLDDLRCAAEVLGVATARMKKDDLKSAIRAADSLGTYRFKEDVAAEIAAITQEKLVGTLQSLEDYRTAAQILGVRKEALGKDELKAAIKAADGAGACRFREDVLVELYDAKTLLKPEQMAAIQSMAYLVRCHAGAAKKLSNGMAEMSGFWRDPETSIECKCRPDFLAVADDTITGIVDVKTCCDASTDAFARSIASLGYDVQAAFYQDGVKAITGMTAPFYFIAVEKEAPFAVAAYKASEEMIETGRAKYRAALQLLQWCRENNRWPAYQPNGEIEEINLPRWAANFELGE
ncbi:MAG: PD-(D/E)XK nuclease-like domain-containing protein [Rhodocyclaceae bacterium]|nr:PD-(D/E)XK nuclease-like domain-containing protein [Rhodocyclaceae bacterium]